VVEINDDLSALSLHGFIESAVEKGSTIVTNGWRGYNGINEKGYVHEIIDRRDEDVLLPHVHTVISLIKGWILGTLQGSCSREYISYYFDEYTFRFNRRKSKSRGCCFTGCYKMPLSWNR
jgi:hypothetical protein